MPKERPGTHQHYTKAGNTPDIKIASTFSSPSRKLSPRDSLVPQIPVPSQIHLTDHQMHSASNPTSTRRYDQNDPIHQSKIEAKNASNEAPLPWSYSVNIINLVPPTEPDQTAKYVYNPIDNWVTDPSP